MSIIDYRTLDFKAASEVLEGKNIVFTGRGFLVRSELMRLARQAGANVESIVTKKCDILIVGEKPGSKLRKAKILGCEIITTNDFKELLECKRKNKENFIDEDILNINVSKNISESINIFKIQKFFKSNLGQRLLKAYKENKQVFRELPFITEIPIKRIEKDLIDKIFNNEKLRLQGIIDCFFEEDDGIVLLDYKTDYVENGKEKEILDKYRVQIDLYTETLERVIGKKVKERYLYLFGIDKEVKYMD